MTRYEKSDAQLDAEAAGRGSLEATVALHRQMRRDDTWIDRMVSRQPPTTFDFGSLRWESHEPAAIGMNMNARLYRYVESAPPSEFPWHNAFRKLRRHCRTNHPYHTGSLMPYWRGSLCQEIVRLVIIGPEKANGRGPLSILAASQVLRYDQPEPVLREALAFIEQSIDAERRKAEKRARDDQGRGDGAIPVERPGHHAVPGLHQAECPQCRRNAA